MTDGRESKNPQDVLKKLNNIIDLFSSLTQSPRKIEIPSAPQLETKGNKKDVLGTIVNNAEDLKEKKSSSDMDKEILAKTKSEKNKNLESDRIVEGFVTDLLAEELVRKLLLNEKIKDDDASQEDGDYSAVEEALTILIGSDPNREQKVSLTFVETAVRLDQFLQDEEEQKRNNN